MFPSLSLTTSNVSDTILYGVLRWIVLVELFQNAWSFSIIAETKSRRGEDGATLVAAKRSSPLPYPWRQSEREYNDEHRLEDIFLDEVDESSGPDDNYHFEDGTFPYAEDDALDTFVARDLEAFDDGDLIFDDERGFPSSSEEPLP
mmetsp:Transcript_63387/g.182472  ORF Transcript_63387/g.182472 Transcript_63387/m.182472 type:complete len:146 (-) Transcript_63387:145-582(-)